MLASPSLIADRFPRAIALDELESAAALQDRVDIKYVVGLDVFATLAERLSRTHAVLEIASRRSFRYHTVYFDTAALTAYRDHVQRRRRRYKCRSREYVDSGVCTFEVKLKGQRGRTIKHRMAYDRARRDELSEPALQFVRDCLERSYGRGPEAELERVLAVTFVRATFAAPGLGERVTCDFDLGFRSPSGATGRLAEDAVIVESKSATGNAVADRVLRSLGARPEGACSKYCLGVGLTNPTVNSNPLRRLLRRYFVPTPADTDPLISTGQAVRFAA